ncbi:MAG: hypothetical protein KatS3mg105_2067 [Gemmatales bacterium]|nr:MAG: hypothetical protein KatS3mg105_2067 [Gemmatales bacterium]
MGGFASFNQSFKHPDRFKTAVGIFPPLNLRWVDCHCRYMANFDPCCWGWRMSVRNGREVIGRFYGIVFVRLKRLIDPLYDRNDPATIYLMSLENPTEMISRLGIGPDTHNLYIGYGGKDEFNIDAQVESFLYVAREHHLPVRVDFIPNGRHNLDTAIRFLPNIIDWLAPILAPYSPEASVENLQTD